MRREQLNATSESHKSGSTLDIVQRCEYLNLLRFQTKQQSSGQAVNLSFLNQTLPV